MEAGKTLMQAEKEKRKWFIRIVSVIASVPVLGVGVGLLYFASIEPDLVYLFMLAALGLIVTLFGFVLFLHGFSSGPKKGKKYVTTDEIATQVAEEQEAQPETPPNKCPHCGTEIVSAGKFCGSCGKSLD